MSVRRRSALGAASLALAAFAAIQPSVGAESFYAGKVLNLIVGISAGGGYDQYARLLARHYPRYIPGAPTIVVRNMPGAGSMTAVGYVENSAPQDGTAIVTFNAGLLGDSVAEGDKARVRFDRFTWIGSIARDFRVCFGRRAAQIETWQDLVGRKTIFGASGLNSNSANGVNMLRNLLGLNIEVISAYPGNNEMNLAIERGEVDGSCISWSSVPDDWVRNKKISAIARLSRATDPEVPATVPFIGDLVASQEQKDIVDLLLASGELGRPYIVSRNVPSERVDTLRAAFDAAVADPTFQAEAAKQGLAVSPVGGAEAEKIVARLYAMPQALVAKANDVLKR